MDVYEAKMSKTKRYIKSKKILKKIFGYDNFKPHQYQIIDNILDVKDVIAIMPTGYGKSLCFQMPPLITKELAIVISPLIALMVDQQMILDNLGINSCCYNSNLSVKQRREVESGLVEGKYQIMYITPESLSKSYELIDKIYENVGICMVAIDEAHCLSSYGYDFRPAYREIIKIRTILKGVPILAVTATATDKVSQDIVDVMDMKNGELIKTSFDRPNLKINVKLYSHNTMDEIIDIIRDANGSTIVYCLTIADTEKMAEMLVEAGIPTKSYHGSLSKNERTQTQEDFMNGVYDCIAATIAFGMGINKSNVRVVIHYGCPQNIDSYYQEIGRAGRDGKDSTCYLYYKQKDFIIQHKFIENIKDVKYRAVRKQLLQYISQYVGTTDCRRKIILQYFGQDTKINNCDNCDNCISRDKKISVIKKIDEYKLFKLLNIVSMSYIEKKASYGATTLSLILKGSNSIKIKPWMKKLTYYGSFNNNILTDISKFIHTVVSLGYLESYNVGDCIYAIRCTDRGHEFKKTYETILNDTMNGNIYKS